MGLSTSEKKELAYRISYAKKDYEEQVGNGKQYDIRLLSGHGKDCLNKILPAIFEQMPLTQLTDCNSNN